MKAKKYTEPIYQKVAIDIAVQIVKGKYPVGDKISGRSTLASQYNVSPETIRRAVAILKDVDIVSVNHGSGVVVTSYDKAYKFIELYRGVQSMSQIKQNISDIIKKRNELNTELEDSVAQLIDYTNRFKNVNPYTPFEIKVTTSFEHCGQTVAYCNFWHNTGATIIAIKKSEEIILSPGPYSTIEDGDTLVIVGNESAYERTKKYLNLE